MPINQSKLDAIRRWFREGGRSIELNPVNNPSPLFMDETPRCQCKCGQWFSMWLDEPNAVVTEFHLAICEGDAAITLLKIEQFYKESRRDLDNPKEARDRREY